MLDSLSQLVIYVDDMELVSRFYIEKLGLRVIKPTHSDDYGKEDFLKFNTGGCSVVLHANRYGYERPENGVARPKIIFAVDDVAAARQGLQERGVAMDEIREAGVGLLISDGRDPEGNPFAIMSGSDLAT